MKVKVLFVGISIVGLLLYLYSSFVVKPNAK